MTEAVGRQTVAMIAVRSTADLAVRNGVNMVPIAERFGISQTNLRNMTGRIEWTRFLDLLEAVTEALGGPEAAMRAASDLVDSLPDIAPIAARFVTPISAMRFVYEVVDHLVLPMVRYEVSDRGGDCIRVVQTVREGYEFRPLAITVGIGVAASMPRYLGRGNATLDVEWRERGARYDIQFPPPKAEAATAPHDANPVINMLRNLGLGHLDAYGPDVPELMAEASARLDRLLRDMVAELATPAFLSHQGQLRALNEVAAEMVKHDPRAPVQGHASTVALLSGQSLVIADTAAPEIERLLGATARRWELSERQVEVLRLLVDGFANKDIAERLAISHRTAESHVSSLLRKVGVESRVHLLSRFWSGA